MSKSANLNYPHTGVPGGKSKGISIKQSFEIKNCFVGPGIGPMNTQTTSSFVMPLFTSPKMSA